MLLTLLVEDNFEFFLKSLIELT